uniref:Uncharacterized protein n=1 Tax=Melopsittacus undulatus TaxID=13146 RepID=A0A8V5HGD3_MELUD
MLRTPAPSEVPQQQRDRISSCCSRSPGSGSVSVGVTPAPTPAPCARPTGNTGGGVPGPALPGSGRARSERRPQEVTAPGGQGRAGHGGSGGQDEAVVRRGRGRAGGGARPLPVLRGVDPDPCPHMAIPNHRPHGDLHIHWSHSGLCGAILCVRRQHGIWEASEVLETGSQQSVLHWFQCLGHGCSRCLRGVQAPDGEALVMLCMEGSLKSRVPNAVPLSVFQHNLCCDNCHSHVALALNLMRYDNSTSWNMVKLCFFSLLYGKYVR